MLIIFFTLLFIFTVGPMWLYSTRSVRMGEHWLDASLEPIGIAPDPKKEKQAIIQVYAARAFNWRGLFAVHCWIAVKAENAPHFTVYQVIGWNVYSQRPLVDVAEGPPDRLWYNHRPKVIHMVEGEQAAQLIPKIEQAVKDYPYAESYHAWPGPNSNTFIAWIGRQVPQLHLVMPASALGKDYLAPRQIFARAPSGWQISWRGVLGVLFSLRSGFQINIMGLTLGLFWWPPTIIMPGIGRLSLSNPW
ncbi:MAG: DUF3750 domain-containing protein [Gammaproteobacteria bacterium]|nr:DUF3750 domain-containing protein [Gammaproteobacteria bacterium]